MQDASIGIRADFDGAEAERKIQSFTKRSTVALNNLSLVIQDLPYGFRGIQNNLPALLQSFTQLDTKGKSLTDVFKEFGNALKIAGPFLAFSAVTAGIDLAIAKYGSLDNAIKALLSNSAKLVEVQNNLNKAIASAQGETAGESAKIEILTKTLTDLSQPMDKRLAAYVGLKKISPDIVAGIRDENALSEASIKLIEQNAKSRLEYLQIRAKEFAITQQLNKIESEYLTLQQEYPNLLAAKDKAQKAYNATSKEGYDATATFMAITANKELTTLAAANNAFEENRKKRKELYDISQDLIKQLEPLVQGTANYDSIIQELTNSLKKANKEPFDPDMFLADWTPKYLSEWVDDYVTAYEKKIKSIRDRFAKTAKNLAEFRLDVLDKRGEGLGKLAPDYTNEVDQIIAANEKLKENFFNTRDYLSSMFFNPLEQLFTNFFETGKFAFKAFGDAVLKEIQRIVSRIIASSIIQLLANILVPGSGAATAVPFDFKKIVSEALGGRNLGRPNTPAMNPGAMNFGGSVALTLRGSDLVAAMNRTNTTINRVG